MFLTLASMFLEKTSPSARCQIPNGENKNISPWHLPQFRTSCFMTLVKTEAQFNETCAVCQLLTPSLNLLYVLLLIKVVPCTFARCAWTWARVNTGYAQKRTSILVTWRGTLWSCPITSTTSP